MNPTGRMGGSICLMMMLSSCGSEATHPTTPAPAAVQPTPLAGAFAVIQSDPPYGGTVLGAQSDLQGTKNLFVFVQTSSARRVSSAYFVLELLDGTTECLRTQIAYCQRYSAGAWGSYEPPGESALYGCGFFVRDNQQPSCGRTFTTTRQRWVLMDRDTGETLVTQEAAGGWSFAFSQ